MPSKYLSTGTASYNSTTRTISGATMSADFALIDQTEQRQVFFRIGTDIFRGRVLTFVSAASIILQVSGDLPGSNGTIDELILLDLGETHSYADYIAELQSLIKDGAVKLTTTDGGDLDKIIAKAIREYSRHKPFYIRKKIAGNGTSSYSIDTIFGSLWRHGFSDIKSIEYPIGEKPIEILEKDDYEIYDDGTAQDGSNLMLRFETDQPSASQYFIVEFQTQMSFPRAGSANFPDTDEHFSNITTLAAAFACQRLAAAYAQSTDGTISADVVNYQDKSAKYSALYKQYLRSYNLSVFGKEDPELSIEAAIVEIDLKSKTNDNRPALFHR